MKHHSYREANQYVNALTNFRFLNADIVYYQSSPTQLSLLVGVDIKGFTAPRLAINVVLVDSFYFLHVNSIYFTPTRVRKIYSLITK